MTDEQYLRLNERQAEREIFREYLENVDRVQKNPDCNIYYPDRELCIARSKFTEIFRKDYSRQAGLYWISVSEEEMAGLLGKDAEVMNLYETLVCLTNIVARDRIHGSISGCENSGAMVKLLGRYLELTKREGAQ